MQWVIMGERGSQVSLTPSLMALVSFADPHSAFIFGTVNLMMVLVWVIVSVRLGTEYEQRARALPIQTEPTHVYVALPLPDKALEQSHPLDH